MTYDSNNDAVIVQHLSSISKVNCTNSLCFSLDGNWMYHADSPTKTIQCYKYDQEKGLPIYTNDFVKFPDDKSSVPDGSIGEYFLFCFMTTF